MLCIAFEKDPHFLSSSSVLGSWVRRISSARVSLSIVLRQPFHMTGLLPPPCRALTIRRIIIRDAPNGRDTGSTACPCWWGREGRGKGITELLNPITVFVYGVTCESTCVVRNAATTVAFIRSQNLEALSISLAVTAASATVSSGSINRRIFKMRFETLL